MTSKKPDTGEVQLPPDVNDVGVLKVLLSVPPMIHESVTALLASQGRLFAIATGKRTLASKADYLGTLSEFCERVPGAANALVETRRLAADRERHQRHMDAATERQKRSMKTSLHDRGGKP